ncbi:MAG: histone deacetylase family protein [Halioglobus sp.]
MAIAYISHPACELHDMGRHPEQPARLTAINDRLIASGLDMALMRYDAPLVDRGLLNIAHDPLFVDQIHNIAPEHGTIWVDGDTAMNPHSLEAALRSAGAVQMAVDLVMAGKAMRTFCGVRPPGHHAEKRKAMGFCFFNNIAVGAYHALVNHDLKRVAIVDFDVHHGNGTEDIVAGDQRILFCSTFQHPFYPNSGVGDTAENVVNVPLSAGAGGAEFKAVVEEHWLPALAEFAPEIIFVSAGFDAHQADDMAGLNFVDEDYHWVTRRLCEQANASAHGRMVSSLEGGYELHALARSVEAHLKAMADP